MSRGYRNPPVVEALCELHFDKHTAWDVTIFGEYYNRVRDEFSQKRELPQTEIAMTAGTIRQQRWLASADETGVDKHVRPAGVRMQFVRPDQTAMVQLAQHLLVVNQLPPYPSWKVFKVLILDCLRDYQDIVTEATLQEVVLRYVNRFIFPAKSFTVGNTFAESNFIPRQLREQGAPFLLRLEMPQADDSRLVLTFGTLEDDAPEHSVVLLDIAVLLTQAKKLNQKSLGEVLDQAHRRIEAVFESCLTDVLRHQFDREVRHQFDREV